MSEATANGLNISNDPGAWLGSQGKGVLKKVSYAVLEWLYKTVGKEDPVPGGKKQEVSGKDFLGALKDGTVLCDAANKLQPGAVESVHKAGENESLTAEKQKENVQNFLTFAKEKAGVKESDLFKAEDLDSPKGCPAVLSTLMSLGVGAKEKFGAEGLNLESLMHMAAESGAKNFVLSLINRIFKKNASTTPPVAEQPKEEEKKEGKDTGEPETGKPTEAPENEKKPEEAPVAPKESAAEE